MYDNDVKRTHWGRLILSLLLLVGFPIFIWAVLTQRIEIRKKAGFTGPTLFTSPQQIVGSAGNSITLGIAMDTAGASVSATEIHIAYNPQIVHLQQFATSSAMPNISFPLTLSTPSATQELITVKVTAPQDAPFVGNNIIGSVTFSLISNTPTYIELSNTSIITTTENPNVNSLAAATGSQINGGSIATPTPPENPTRSLQPECGSCYTNTGCNPGLICQFVPSPTPYCPNGSGGSCAVPANYPRQVCVKPDGSSVCPIGQIPTVMPRGCRAIPMECFQAPCPTQILCSSTPTPSSSLSSFTVNGVVSPTTMPPGFNMAFSAVVTQPDGTPGTPGDGFNVQAYIENATPGSGPATPGANGVYDASLHWWRFDNNFLAPYTIGGYRLVLYAYCAVDNSRCSQLYGPNHQEQWSINITVTGYPTTIASPTPATCSPRPSCLDTNPRCLLPEPSGGWCTSTPTPTPTPTPYQVTCNRDIPKVTIAPQSQSGNPGEALTYVATVTNADSAGCGSSPFSFSYHVDTNFSAQLGATNVIIPAGGTTNVRFIVTSPGSNPNTNSSYVPVSFIATNTQSNQTNSANASYYFLRPEPQPMIFHVKFAGVTGAEADKKTISIRFFLQDGRMMDFLAPLTVKHIGNGVYEAGGTLSNPLPTNTPFTIGIKGEKHVRLRFCQITGQTIPCAYGQTMTYTQAIPITFEFTGRSLPAGDLNQDNQIDTKDIKLMTDIFNKPTSLVTDADRTIADVNYDGYVDNNDLILLLQSLSTRYDE